MTNSPVISVIIPVFNQERYLDQCVRSVLNQNFHDFEVILVNDGSTDRSLEICQKYVNCDSRFILINKKMRELFWHDVMVCLKQVENTIFFWTTMII